MNYREIALLLALFITVDVKAQSTFISRPIEEVIEMITSRAGELDNGLFISVEDLVDRYHNPINLNRVTEQELTELFILSPNQILGILDYLKKEGSFQTIYELQLIKELDRETLEFLVPFVFIGNPNSKNKLNKNIFKNLKQDIIVRFDFPGTIKKTDKEKFLGPSFYSSIRYSAQIKDRVFIGLIAEKDKGEPLFGPHNKYGYDYYSYYILLEKWGRLESFIIGKYRLNLGLGLTSGVRSFGGNSSIINTFFSQQKEILKHSSMDELNYLNGLAFRYRINPFKVLLFGSIKSLDATIKEGEISSFITTGLHQNSKDFEKKNTVKSYLLGGRIMTEKSGIKIGFNYLIYGFNKPINNGDLPYKKHDIRGSSFYNLSVDYSLNYRRFLLRGESALSKKGAAFLHQLYYSINSEHEFLLMHRFYDINYWSFYGKSFGSQSKIRNENGWFLAYQTTALWKFKVNISANLSSFPGWKYRVSKPSKSIELSMNSIYTLNRDQTLGLSYMFFKKERDQSYSKPKITELISSHRLGASYEWRGLHWLQNKIHLHYNLFKDRKGYRGYHITDRVSFLLFKEKFKLDVQLSYFDSNSYDSRVYIYEKGLLYSFSNYSYNDKGLRGSVNLNFKPIKRITLMFKAGMSSFKRDKQNKNTDNQDVVDSKLDLQCMVRLKL